jgi:hypothetical protein
MPHRRTAFFFNLQAGSSALRKTQSSRAPHVHVTRQGDSEGRTELIIEADSKNQRAVRVPGGVITPLEAAPPQATVQCYQAARVIIGAAASAGDTTSYSSTRPARVTVKRLRRAAAAALGSGSGSPAVLQRNGFRGWP